MNNAFTVLFALIVCINNCYSLEEIGILEEKFFKTIKANDNTPEHKKSRLSFEKNAILKSNIYIAEGIGCKENVDCVKISTGPCCSFSCVSRYNQVPPVYMVPMVCAMLCGDTQRFCVCQNDKCSYGD